MKEENITVEEHFRHNTRSETGGICLS